VALREFVAQRHGRSHEYSILGKRSELRP